MHFSPDRPSEHGEECVYRPVVDCALCKRPHVKLIRMGNKSFARNESVQARMHNMDGLYIAERQAGEQGEAGRGRAGIEDGAGEDSIRSGERQGV